MERQFTATVYILFENKLLLHKHPKFNKWLPPGGHLELNETPPEAARREVKEETGLDIDFLSDEFVVGAYPHAISLPRPFLCLLENIPALNDKPAHQHIDSIYVARPAVLSQLSDIPAHFKWFSAYELVSIEHELFEDTQHVAAALLTTSDGGVSLPSVLSERLQPLYLARHMK